MSELEALRLFDDARRIGVWLGLLLLVAVLVRKRAGEWRTLPLALSVFAIALVARLSAPTWAPLHANDHGITELRGMLAGSEGTPSGDEAEQYGAGYPQLMRVVTRLTGPRYEVILIFGALAGALCCAALFLFTRRLFQSTAAGVVAGLGLAIHPAWVILSLSESPWPFAMAAFLLALIAGDAAVRAGSPERSRWLAWLWGLLLALACEVHIATAVLPGVALAFLWVALEGWPRGAGRAFIGPFGLVVLTSASHALIVSSTEIGDKVAERADFLSRAFWGAREDLFAHPELSPVVLLPAFVAASLFLWSRRPRLVLACWLGVALILIPGFTVLGCRTDAIRYQTPAHVFAYLPIAGALASSRLRAFLTAPVLLALGIGLPEAARSAANPSLDAAAFVQLARAANQLPPSVTIGVPPGAMSNGTTGWVLSDFPDFLVKRPGRSVEIDTAAQLADWNSIPQFIYLSPACYCFTREEQASGLEAMPTFNGESIRPECSRLAQLADLPAAHPFAKEMAVPWRDWEFHVVVARHPLVGLLPTKAGGRAAAPATTENH